MSGAEAVRILYMEDDPGLARLLQKTLGRLGYVVELAADGEQGLSLIGGSRYEVVLVDYNMPVLGGMEVMRHLSGRDDAPPVIMLTGNGNEKVAVEAMKLGAVDYIVKDLDLGYQQLLPLVIEQVLERGKLIRERERMLLELSDSEERYRKLVELSPDGIAVHAAGRFEFINPAGAEILGAGAAEELLGMEVVQVIHPDYRQVFAEREALLANTALDIPWMEEKILRLDGTEVDVELKAFPFLYNGRAATQTIFRDITERKLAKMRLERMANYDALTALPNRTLLFDRLNQRILKAKRWREKFALLFIDLDHFKKLNDTMGHYCGDIVLKEVAKRLTSALRESDTVARMGGDEFVVLLPKMSDACYASQVAEKIMEALGRPFSIEGNLCYLGASIGISVYPDDGTDAEILLIKADKSMYRDKVARRAGQLPGN